MIVGIRRQWDLGQRVGYTGRTPLGVCLGRGVLEEGVSP